MIVELIGAPGAGKTTLLPAAAAFFERRGLRAMTVVEAARPFAGRTRPGRVIGRFGPQAWQRPLLWQLFYALARRERRRFFRQNPELLQLVAPFQAARPIPAAERRHVLRWFYHQAGSRAFLLTQARPDEVLLFDEGFAHRVVQLYASEREIPSLSHMARYLDLIPRPDLLIVVQADLATCEERVAARGIWPRFRHKSPAEISAYMAQAHAVAAAAAAHLRRRGWPLVEIENDGRDPAAAQAALLAALRAWREPAVGDSRTVPAMLLNGKG